MTVLLALAASFSFAADSAVSENDILAREMLEALLDAAEPDRARRPRGETAPPSQGSPLTPLAAILGLGFAPAAYWFWRGR